ncbi:MAG: hypothetical protein LBB75_09375, partial [Oscillospiraceae bacterium]|nr:hypothetical protein [Oscillospiraceae bacterium]
YYSGDGNLVLQIVEGCAAKDAGLYDRVKDFAAQADGLVVENVQYSYNEIHGLMDTLNAMCLAYGRPAAFDNVDWFGEDTSGNRVVMNLAVCSEEEIARFRDTVSDSPMIGFEQSQGKLVEISAASINWVGVAVIIALLGLIGLGTILLWRAVRRGKRESI